MGICEICQVSRRFVSKAKKRDGKDPAEVCLMSGSDKNSQTK